MFKLDNFETDENLLFNLCEILDLGQKFVPNFYKNKVNFTRFFYNNLDMSLLNFNKFLFFCKQNYLKTSSNSSCVKKCRNNLNKDFMFHLNKFTRENPLHKINLLQETLILRDLMIKSFSELKFKNHKNLSDEQFSFLVKFLREKPFLIISCDKNIGFALIKKELYIKLANEHLLADTTYSKLQHNPLFETVNKIKQELDNLLNKGHISNEFHKKFKFIGCKLGKFKLMPKLHKSKFGIRPIISSINHPTKDLCFFVDNVFKSFVSKSETVLKDSQNLLQNTNNIVCNEKTELFSMDFVSLYTNINSKHAIDTLMDFLNKNFKSFHIDNYGFSKILKLIFYNNVFEFEKKFYIQTNGLAMGSICGPSIANLYLYILEKNWYYIEKPLAYHRFIDDIILISNKNVNIKNLEKQFGNLKLEITNDKEVVFLDLRISVDKLLNRLKFNLYTKPTNAGQFLYKTSDHPVHIFKNIPKASFMRIKRICSNFYDYLFHSRNLIMQLIKRGYGINFLISIMKVVNNIDKSMLLKYKDKSINKENKNSIRFFINFDRNFLSLKNILLENFEFIKKDFAWLSNFNILFTNKISLNLKQILIDKTVYNTNHNFFTKQCLNENCQICQYIYNVNHVKINHFILPLISSSDCNSSGIIYIIKCIKCSLFYVGESQFCAKKRITQHLYNIRKFKPYVKEISEISHHFNLKGHNIVTDFKFCIFKNNVFEKEKRLDIETDIIHFLDNYGVTINKKKANCLYIKKLSFL